MPVVPDFRDPGLKAVSFDIFDTLIQRACGAPHLVFALMEAEARKIGGRSLEAFQPIRVRLERQARLGLPEPRREVGLAEIYRVFVDLGLVTDAQAGDLMALELAAEKRLLMRRESGCLLLEEARRAGKRLILVSDMYLPRETVNGILDNAGLGGAGAVYLSSERGEMKYYGGLWDLLLREEGLAPGELLHVGDNEISDVKTAAERGIRTLFLPRPLENFKKHPANRELFAKGFPDEIFPNASIFPALAQGLTAARFYDRPRPGTDGLFQSPFHLGYAALGPAATAFALWLARQARRDGVEELFFLSRDGFLLKAAYDVLAPALGLETGSRYLLNSRKVTAVAGMRGAAEIITAVMSYFQPGPLVRWLNDKFLLRPEDLPADLAGRHGFAAESPVSMADRDRLLALCLDLRPVILNKAAEKKLALTAYLAESGFLADRRKAVVDIGFSGQIQASLAALADDSDLAGYYFFTDYRAGRAGRHGLALRSFFEGLTDTFSPQFVHKYLYHCYFETFFKDGREGALDDLELDERGRPRPIFRPLTAEANRRILSETAAGALDFAADFREKFGPWLPLIEVNPQTAAMTYLQFLTHPHPGDAALVQGLVVDDSYNGTDRRYFLAPDGRGESTWKEGAAAAAALERDARSPISAPEVCA